MEGKKVLIMERDLLLASKVKSALRDFEVRVGDNYEREEIVIINIEAFDVSLINNLRKSGAIVIGYCSHVKTDLMQRAKQEGANLVVPRSQVVKDLSALIEQAQISITEQQN
ncbi:MAG: hypothetical protein NZL90_04840 [Aquificaceae bacterium]|nr:hypothetical protein [Aquificaceae bacterium]MDW8237872.1 hypothetical protein [Aquificaceae bacterium]